MVTVAILIGPNKAASGSLGPSNIVKASCHSTSLLYSMSTGNSTSRTPVDKWTFSTDYIKYVVQDNSKQLSKKTLSSQQGIRDKLSKKTNCPCYNNLTTLGKNPSLTIFFFYPTTCVYCPTKKLFSVHCLLAIFRSHKYNFFLFDIHVCMYV